MDKKQVMIQLHQVLEQFDLSRQSKDTLANVFAQVIETAIEGINPDMTQWLKKSEYNEKENALKETLVNKSEYEATLLTLVTNDALNQKLLEYTTLTKLKEEVAKLVTITEYNAKVAELTNKFNDYETTTDHAADIQTINTALDKKFNAADIVNYYEKSTVDTKLGEKVTQTAYDLEKQSFATKTDIANMVTSSDLDGYATKDYVDSFVHPTSKIDTINLNDASGNAKDAMELVKELINALTNVGIANGYGQ